MPDNNEEYPYIQWWGKRMGSYDYYITAQQEKAAADKAPRTAIYERDGKWFTIHDISNPSLLENLKKRFGHDVLEREKS